MLILIGILITVVTGLPVFLQLRKNHPRGLMVLFFAEMWERFSYYGMRAILVFYLTQHLLFDDDVAGAQYGSYTALVYLVPLLGGVLADRYLGTRKAIAFGALLLVAGHCTMAIEGRPATERLVYAGQSYEVAIAGRLEARETRLIVDGQPHAFSADETGALKIEGLAPGGALPPVLPAGSFTQVKSVDPFGQNAFYLAVSLIIMGVGFLKPNISTAVGQLYKDGDPRRDSGFTLYYYGINLGAFWASILCGLLAAKVGWWAGFGLAGLGMAAGFVVFVLGRSWLDGVGEPPNPEQLKTPLAGPINREWLIYGLGVIGVLPIWWLVQRNEVVGWALGVATVASIAAIAAIIVFLCKTMLERWRMLLAAVLIVGSVIFFTLFEQAGTSLNLFAARNVDLYLGDGIAGWAHWLNSFLPKDMQLEDTISAAQTQSFNAGFILIFAPVFAALWAWLGARGRDFDPVAKFGLALVQVGLGFMVVVWGAPLVGPDFQAPLFLLVLLYLLHTTGELFLSPVGLSEITKLSVKSVVSFMMAVWFLSSSIAQYVGGWIAGLAKTETVGGQVLDPGAALASSLKVFNMLGLWGMGLGVVFLVLALVIHLARRGTGAPPLAAAHGGLAPEPIAPTPDGERQSVSPQIVRGERDGEGAP